MIVVARQLHLHEFNPLRMSAKILIVEDQFVEAYGISLILEPAGYTILGIEASVEDALVSIKRETPDLVLLDIYLQTELTGIDLARILAEKNIPFIYLSANSNASVLQAAKETQPYGFLVKPFRNNDVLIALDIARYRHSHALDLIEKQSNWLSSLLSGIKPSDTDYENKLLQLIKAFRPYLPFDFAIADLDTKSDSPKTLYGFKRRDFDDYSIYNGWDVIENLRISFGELNAFRRLYANHEELVYKTGDGFTAASEQNILLERLHLLYDSKACLCIPGKDTSGTGVKLTFFNTARDSFTGEHIRLLHPLRPLIVRIIENIRGLREDTKKPPANIHQKDKAEPVLPDIIGKSPGLLQVLDQVWQVAGSDTTVLIMGETGVGKEALVRAIHYRSKRKDHPLIKLNCAAIPATLIEAELFGHEKGAFTGATERRIGKFEQAQGGTIFLDEIGEMPIEIQSKLLRVIQERELERLGSKSTTKIDVRIIAATNRDLHKEVAAGNFRIDLYYRINVFPILVPPLRERREDIPLLAEYFLRQQASSSGKPAKELTRDALHQLVQYDWPGNIRQLQHLIERHVLLTKEESIKNFALPSNEGIPEPPIQHPPAAAEEKDPEKAAIIAALIKTGGKISGKLGAAALLNMPPTTLNYKIKKLGIRWNYLLD